MKALLAFVACALALVPAGSAQSEEYPARPVELIVPWSPGGGSDTIMRIVARMIEPYLGVPMQVVNMPGLSGTTGLRAAAAQAPDGYTLAQLHEGLLIAHKTGLTEISRDDFVPVAMVSSSAQYLAVGADTPWRDFRSFAAFVQENPGQVGIGVTLGGVSHLHAAVIEDAIGGDFDYRGFEGTAAVDAAIVDFAAVCDEVEAGRVRLLAVGTAQRLPTTPDVPTLTELGHDIDLTVTRGIVLPLGARPEVAAVVEDALARLSRDEAFRAALTELGAEPAFAGKEAYQERLRKLDAMIDRVISRLN